MGRTARANRSGKAVSLVTQYDVEMYQRLEKLLGKTLPQFPAPKESVMILKERVSEAQRYANMEMKDLESFKDGKDKGGFKKSFKQKRPNSKS